MQKFSSLTRHIYFIDFVLFAKPLWDKLNADETQGDPGRGGRSAGLRPRRGARRGRQDHRRQGPQDAVNEDIAPAEMRKFRAAAKPVIDKYAAAADPAAAKELFDSIAKVRKAVEIANA